ncbi:MAG: RlpA-like double-psi beta-barrel domain-containing protein [Fibrobacter sp.]|nr:RlpA-like double-psi beta-barrel domain-containing protein [Fibrobacter sp.]
MRWLGIASAVSALVAGCGSDEVNAPNVESSSSSIDEILSSSEKVQSSSAIEASSSSAKVLSSSSSLLESSSSNDVVISSGSAAVSESDLWYFDDTDGECENCDSFTAKDPVLTDRGGEGSITTYGSITEKEASSGGACNYGKTDIHYYAAIHVNVSSGDDKGPWNGGLACGGCVRVKAKTPDGWKRVTVRIMDRCPDESCGVDLGGAPASDIMGNTVGRYYGEWEFVSCEGVEGVWDDSTSIWVKEGASAYWSVIQIRNPKDAVTSISIDGSELSLFTGAENFWEVPQEILQSNSDVKIQVEYRSGTPDVWNISGVALTKEMTNYYLYDYRE